MFFDGAKIPPQAVDLEEVILGAAMLEREGTDVAVRLLSPGTFYKNANKTIFDTICKLFKKDLPVDIMTVTEHLRSLGELEAVGGPNYIVSLTDRVASSANIEVHARILLQKYIQRELIRVSSEIIKDAYEDTTDVFDLMEKVEHEFRVIGEILTRGASAKEIARLLDDVENALLQREGMAKQGKCTGVPTGLLRLNKITGGWQGSQLTVLAARPAMGKTALMLFFAQQAAKSGVPVCLYSLEMSDVSLGDRLVLSASDIDIDHFKSGYMSSYDWSEFRKAKQVLSELPIYVDDNPVVSMNYIKSHSRMMHQKGKCGIIFVDYLQLTDMRLEEKNRNREQEVAQASRQAKIIAKSLNIPFILLSQLNRSVEATNDKRPRLSDLRESGAIEQDADMVVFIFRPAYYGIMHDSAQNSTVGVGQLLIEKNRHGATGDVPFRHNESMTKIYDYGTENTDPF